MASSSTIPRVAARRHGGSHRPRRGSQLSYIVLLVPVTLLLVIFLGYPLVSAFSLSFQNASTFTGAADFIGLANFAKFFQTPDAVGLIAHTYLRAFGGVVPSFILGLGTALALNRPLRRMSTLARVLVLLPFAISGPVGIVMWQNLLDPRFGLPAALGIQIPDLFSSPSLVWPTILFINMWASYPFYTILLLAGLQRIPTDLYEAAQIDGAGVFSRFRYVTLPGIAVISVGALAIHFMASFQDFNLVYLTTGGGPLGMTQTLPTYSYANAFAGGFDIGYGAALSVLNLIMMLITLVVLGATYFVVRNARRRRQERRVAAMVAGATHATAGSARQWLRPPPRAPRRSSRRQPRIGWIWTVVFILFSLFPILFLVSQAFNADTSGKPELIPSHFTFQNIVNVFTNGALWQWQGGVPPISVNFLNSAIVTVAVTLLTVVIGALAGFSLARWRSRTARGYTGALVVVQFVPGIMLLFPLYLLLARLGLLDTLPGLILATTAAGICAAVLFFRLYFHDMPREMEEAAALDGAGTLRTLFQVVLPNSWAGVAAIAGFTIVGTWNEFIFALTFISNPELRTFPPALSLLTSSFVFASANSPGEQAVFLLIPIVTSAIMLGFTVRHLTAAVAGGGAKG